MSEKLDKSNPKNFSPTSWRKVKPGDAVYLMGTNLRHFRAYGPHTVVDPNKMILKNALGETFLQYQEILGIEKKGD